ncbi:MAG: hypothetical protein J5836_01285 [Clostridia bacterium]|nr:hypothetical protein [Clostridia bacterium]
MADKLLKLIAAVISLSLVLTVSACGDEITPVSDDSDKGQYLNAEEDKTAADYSAKENLYIAASKLASAGGFRAETEGESRSLAGITNAVRTRRIVLNGVVFKESRSYSSLVKLASQTYVSGENYLVRDKKSMSSIDSVVWKDEVTRLTRSEFLNNYGLVQDGISSYVLNDDTILSAEKISEEGGVFTFKYSLDTIKATEKIKYEMVYSAGASSFPEFKYAEMTVKMTADWTVKSIHYDSEYVITKIIKATCTESLTETFYDIGKVTEIAESEFFGSFCVGGAQSE